MTTLKALNRPAKWRDNVRKELSMTVSSGYQIYGVGRDGKYVVKTSTGIHVCPDRNVKGTVAAKRATAD